MELTKNKFLKFNLLFFCITLGMLIWNYHVYNQIDPVHKEALNLLKDANETYNKIRDYKSYKKALQSSGMSQAELEEHLVKYGDGSLYEKMRDINLVIEEEDLYVALVSLKILLTYHDESKFNQTKQILIKKVRTYYHEKIENKKENELTKNQQEFKKRYLKLKEQT